MRVTGIYQIQSRIKPERIYIGSASDIYVRWRGHLCSLRKGKHHSSKLQNHFNKYGETDLQYSILLGCDKEDRIKIEQYFIDSHHPYFNISKMAQTSGCGFKKGHIPFTKGTKLSKVHKYRISEALKGKKHSIETREKISIGHIGAFRSPEMRQKLREAHLGEKQSQERINKRAASNKGKKRTPEQVLRIVNATREAKLRNKILKCA
jgi:group I intron endonuclease